MSKHEIFKPSDFYFNNVESPIDQAVRQANHTINLLIGKKVYAHLYGDESDKIQPWMEEQGPHDTHSAFLFNVQPIKECEHPLVLKQQSSNVGKCKICCQQVERILTEKWVTFK